MKYPAKRMLVAYNALMPELSLTWKKYKKKTTQKKKVRKKIFKKKKKNYLRNNMKDTRHMSKNNPA